jgi:hypothetical protein
MDHRSKGYSAEEIAVIAKRAGLRLTPEWRDELILGSRIVILAKLWIRKPLQMSAASGVDSALHS